VNAPCEKSPTAETAGNCPPPNENQPAIESLKRTCPDKHLTKTNINGVQYQYWCSHSFSPLGAQSIANVFDYRSCASLCSDDDYCRGFTWNSEKATCHFVPESEPLIKGPASSLAMWATLPRGDSVFCPKNDRKVYAISGESYKVDCYSRLTSKTESSIGDTASAMECGRKCSADLTCENLTWNSNTKVCTFHNADPDAKSSFSKETYNLQKINSPGNKQKVQSGLEPSGQGDYHLRGLGNFCNDGPKFGNSMDLDDNRDRRLLTIGGETFLLSCTTIIYDLDDTTLYDLTPWRCAEACAEDKYCAGVTWSSQGPGNHDMGCKLSSFAKKGTNFGTRIIPSGDFVTQVALIKKSVKGKMKFCVVPEPTSSTERKVGECPDSD